MTRLPDWPERLNEFLDARRFEPFAWGSNDCAMFWADSKIVLTGVDPFKKYRGYKTEKTAMRKLAKVGGLRAAIGDVIEKHPGLGQRGDGVISLIENRETLGVVVGDGTWCGPGRDGWVQRPMSEVKLCFQV